MANRFQVTVAALAVGFTFACRTSTPAAGPAAPKAEKKSAATPLNTEGYELYKKQKYAQAAAKFEQAIAADPNHALAHYNLACALSLLRTESVCEHDAYKSRIIEHLRKAVKLDETRRKKIREDSDLDSVRDTFGYHELIGYHVSEPEDVRIIISGVTWYGPAPGALGPTSGIDFDPGGLATLWVLQVDDDVPHRERHRGTWKVDGSQIVLELVEAYDGKTRFQGVLQTDGRLVFEGLETFTDDPDECSA